jgi:hypothetical protein
MVFALAGDSTMTNDLATRSDSYPPIRLLKKAHLLRWNAQALAAAYLQYASLGLPHSALHLNLFEQPGR